MKSSERGGGGRWCCAAGTNGVEGCGVPVGHDVATGGDANTGRKIYSADAGDKDETSKKSVHRGILLSTNSGPVVRFNRFLCQACSEPLFPVTTIDGSSQSSQ